MLKSPQVLVKSPQILLIHKQLHDNSMPHAHLIRFIPIKFSPIESHGENKHEIAICFAIQIHHSTTISCINSQVFCW